MNAEEAATLCRLAKTISPSQPVDEFTPAAWALILEDVRFVDARQALKELGGEQEWLHVSHIVKRVKKIRGERIARYFANVQPPNGLDAAEYDEWYRTTRKRIGDGDYTPEPPAAVEGGKRNLGELGQAGQPVERIKSLRAAQEETRRRMADAKAERERKHEEQRQHQQAARQAARAELRGRNETPEGEMA